MNSQKTIAKENQLCGCPTTEFENGYCERLKKSCSKHINWENLRRSHIFQERMRLVCYFYKKIISDFLLE